MKAATATAAGFCLALASGGIGFWLGRSFQPSPPAADSSPPTATAQRQRAAGSSMSKIQAQQLVSLLDSQPDPLTRFAIALDNMEDWVAADPAGALAWLANQPRTARRNEIIRLAVFQWAESDPAAAATWSRDHLQGVELNNMLIRLAEQWIQVDPLAAARWFSRMPAGPSRTGPLEGMFFRWGSDNPAAARGFLENELPGDSDTPHILQAIHAGWAKSDPHAAVTSSLAASRALKNPSLFANTLANWATVDVASSASWLLKNVPAGPERGPAIGELAGMFADQDPASGLAWIGQLNPDERPAARNALAMAWAESDPESAARWLSSDTNIGLDPTTTSTVLINFFAQDQSGFSAWRDSLPAGPLKQQATELSQAPDTEQ